MRKDNFSNKGKAHYLNLKNKYIAAAKEANSLGDKVLSEYNLQFAEHYGRVIAERFKQQPPSTKPENNKPQTIEKTDSTDEPTTGA